MEQAARESVEIDAARDAQTAAYKAMYVLAGHLPHFEDSPRALFAWDLVKVTELMTDWPADIARYLGRLLAVVAERRIAAAGPPLTEVEAG